MARTTFSGPVKSNNGFEGDLDATTVLTHGVVFDTTTPNAVTTGGVSWNTQDGTLDVGLNSSVTLQVGLETLYVVRNQTGSTITDGTVVRFAGALGNSGKLLATPAIASELIAPEYLMGVATQDILNGESGYVTAFGIVRGINTTGGAENWQDGDLLYVSSTTAGVLTKTPPTSPKPKLLVAAVVNAATNGMLFVRPLFGDSLANLHDVNITNPQEGDVLKYNSTSKIWYNTQP